MNDKLQKILEAKRIKEEIVILNKHLTPTLNDIKTIDVIYELFLIFVKEKNYKTQCVYHRSKFLFIIIMLYSPATLIGGSMIIGLRDKLADICNVSSRSIISDNVSRMIFLFEKYSDFRDDVDSFYEIIQKKINLN